MDKKIVISLFDNREDAVVDKMTTIMWSELQDILSTHVLRDTGNPVVDKNGDAFQCVEFKNVEDIDNEGNIINGFPRRVRENAKLYYALHFDIDGGCNIEEGRKIFSAYEHCGYTSYNHWREYGLNKFRIIVPLDTPVPAHDIETRAKSIIRWTGGILDKSTLNISRIFYFPATSKSGMLFARTWRNNTNKFFDVYKFEEEKVFIEPVNVVISSTGNDNDIKVSIMKELKKIVEKGALNDYFDWLSVGASMHNSEGFDVDDFKAISWPSAATVCMEKWRYWDRHAPPGNRGFLVNFIRNNGVSGFLKRKAKYIGGKNG